MKLLRLSEPQHGWIEITFGQEPETCRLTASDIPNDCLQELAAATARLVRGSLSETVEFSLEPDFATVEFTRDGESVRLRITEAENAVAIFVATFPLHAFAQRLRFELLRTEESFADPNHWAQPFPRGEVSNLEAASAA